MKNIKIYFLINNNAKTEIILKMNFGIKLISYCAIAFFLKNNLIITNNNNKLMMNLLHSSRYFSELSLIVLGSYSIEYFDEMR